VLRHRLGSSLYEEYTNNWTTVDLAVENILDAGDDFWLPPGYDSFDHCVAEALEEGVADLENVFGTTDQATWQWGRIHHLTLRYPLGLFWPLDRIFNVGPVPIGGDGTTVWPTTPASDSITQVHARGLIGGRIDMPALPDPEDHSAYGGPVLRMVLDFDDLDNSTLVLDFGQSGHRLSRHYADHFPLWKNVDCFPFPYSREKVLENRRSTLLFRP